MTATNAFLFPGQGAQQVGMGKDLYEAFAAPRRIFEQAEAACGLPLRKLCFEGPKEELARTDVCQPAIFTVSAAALAVVDDLLSPEQAQQLRPAYLAGLSLGEYTALYAADAIDLAPAVRLVARRGQLMQQAAQAVPSGMVAVSGLDEAKAQELAAAAAGGETMTCANFNCPGQIVLSGSAAACKRVEDLAASFGAKGAMSLEVAGAFHSRIMAPAAEGLARELATVQFRTPNRPVVANVDGKCYADASEIPGKLLAQLTSAVRWQQSMEFLIGQGVKQFQEIGPGRVLAGLMRRIDRQAEVTSLNSREAIEKFYKAIAG
jgi:[acyl-carrier-protein] S-malonyltransferase